MNPELKRLFETIEKSNEEFQHFIKSDYCGECGGVGHVLELGDHVQCEECERLHKLEIRADRMHDLAKGD